MYRVIVNGVVIEVETADQAIELANKAGGADASPGRKNRISNPNSLATRWTDRRVRELLKQLSPQQRRLVDVLLESPDGRTDTQLVQALGLKNNSALGGVFTGLIRNVKKVGGNPGELYSWDEVPIGDEMHLEYKLSDAFRSVAEQVSAAG